jgi:hypothetical protein
MVPAESLQSRNKVNLVLANMFWAEAIWRTVEVLREILYGVDIGTDGVLSVVTTLELVQHQLPESGHSNLLVTQNLTWATMLATTTR